MSRKRAARGRWERAEGDTDIVDSEVPAENVCRRTRPWSVGCPDIVADGSPHLRGIRYYPSMPNFSHQGQRAGILGRTYLRWLSGGRGPSSRRRLAMVIGGGYTVTGIAAGVYFDSRMFPPSNEQAAHPTRYWLPLLLGESLVAVFFVAILIIALNRIERRVRMKASSRLLQLHEQMGELANALAATQQEVDELFHEAATLEQKAKDSEALSRISSEQADALIRAGKKSTWQGIWANAIFFLLGIAAAYLQGKFLGGN